MSQNKIQQSNRSKASLPVAVRRSVLSHRRKSGFTLVEVLVVILIIGVLAAILFPLARSMKNRANESVCAGNMRQLGIAVMGYAAENGMRLPPNTADNPNGKSQLPMFEVLRSYTGEGATLSRISLWECPSQTIFKKETNGIAHGYSGNPQLFVNARSTASGGTVKPEDLSALVSLASIPRPSEVFMFIDASQREGSGWATSILNGIGERSKGNSDNGNKPMTGKPFIEDDKDVATGVARYRHGAAGKEGTNNLAGKANVIFLDGHVESVRKGGILQKNVYTNY